MTRMSILLSGLFLSGCAFDLSPAPRSVLPSPEPALAASQTPEPAMAMPQPAAATAPASDMPSMGEVQNINTANVQRPITGSCGMEGLQHYVNQPRIEVDSRVLPENYRVVGRYSRPTMDYVPERLTIRIADDDTVESLTCG